MADSDCKVCKRCGKEFAPASWNAIYCCRECNLAAWHVKRQAGREDLKYICTFCGRKYNAKSVERNKYCSRHCKFSHQQQRAKGKWKHWWFRNCGVCGKRYIGRKNSRLCGDSDCCKEDERRKSRAHLIRKDARDRTARACLECGGVFSPEYGNKHRRYCSTDCSEKSNKRVAKRKRRALERGVEAEAVNPSDIFNRDGWCCHLCGIRTPRRLRGTRDDRAPEMDHIIPLAVGGKHVADNLACACRRCNIAKGSKELGQLRLSA